MCRGRFLAHKVLGEREKKRDREREGEREGESGREGGRRIHKFFLRVIYVSYKCVEYIHTWVYMYICTRTYIYICIQLHIYICVTLYLYLVQHLHRGIERLAVCFSTTQCFSQSVSYLLAPSPALGLHYLQPAFGSCAPSPALGLHFLQCSLISSSRIG